MEKQVIIPLEEYNNIILVSSKQYQDEETLKIIENLRADYTKEKRFNDALQGENLSLRQDNDSLVAANRQNGERIRELKEEKDILIRGAGFLLILTVVFVVLYIIK